VANLAAFSDRLFGNVLIRRMLRNSGYLFSATGIAAFLSMLQSILAARLLGVTDFGVLGTITMFTSVINKFASFRMGELVVKYIGQFTVNGDDRRAAAVFKTAGFVEILTSFFAFGLIWLLAPLGAVYFAKDAGTAEWFILYGFIVLANLMAESSTGLMQIFDKYRIIAGITVGQSFLTLGLISLAYLTQGGLREVLLAYMSGKIAGAVALTLVALAIATRRWGLSWWRTPISLLHGERQELVRFALSTNVSATINLVNKDGELLWVSALRNPTEAGYYKLALSLINLVQLPVAPLPQATYPELSREVAARRWSNVRFVLRQGSLFALAYSGAASLFLLLFGRPVIRTIYTPDFLPAYPALLILMGGALVANTFYWNRIALLSLGLAGYPARVNLAAAALKIAGVLTIVPKYGYLGSASLLSGYYLFSVLLNFHKTRAELNRHGSDSG
jgi:O-antigen/teichoic acid export membrane protein